MTRFSSAIALLAAFLLAGHAFADPLDELAGRLEADLEDEVVGYGYAIFQGNDLVRSGGGGHRVLPITKFPSGLPFNSGTRKDCHSMSKTITAVAMVRALSKNPGRNLDSKIHQDLPIALQNVITDDRIEEITYRHLLSHHSGLPKNSSYAWADVRNELSSDLLSEPGDKYLYSNAGFALCRILLPFVWQNQMMRSTEALTLFHPDHQQIMNSLTASTYREYAQTFVLEPAGITTATVRPLADPAIDGSYNFSYYFNHWEPSTPPLLMPDRRLTVGSGGWAMSAISYGKFIARLFPTGFTYFPAGGTDYLGEMKDDNLGLFRGGLSDGTTYYSHSGSTTDTGVGGKSYWMHVPTGFSQMDITIVVQTNSAAPGYGVAGASLGRIVNEAYQNTFSSPTAIETEYNLNILFRREGDGKITTRGVRENGSSVERGSFAERNLDDDWTSGWTGFASYENSLGTYALHYKADNGDSNGRAQMMRVNTDGTFGQTIFNESNWRAGWTHLEFFEKGDDDFLLLYNANDFKLRIFEMGSNGTLLTPAVTDITAASGFNLLTIMDIDNVDYLFRYSTSSGRVLLTPFNSNGSLGSTDPVNDRNWADGFTSIHFFRAVDENTNATKEYLLRYSTNNGRARVNEIKGPDLSLVTEVSDEFWLSNWDLIEFYEIGDETYIIRYDPETGHLNRKRVGSGGVIPDDDDSAGGYLRAKRSAGLTGWTEIEFYASGPGASLPFSEAPTPDESEPPADTIAPITHLPTPVIPLPPVDADVAIGGSGIEFTWPHGSADTLHFVQSSTTLDDWTTEGFYTDPDPTGADHQSLIPRQTGETRRFGRILSITAAPPEAEPQ